MDGDVGVDFGLGMSGNMSMGMLFYFGDHFHLLFKQLMISNPGGLVGAIFVVMVVAVLYEGLKSVREVLVLYEVKRKNFVHHSHREAEERQPLLAESSTNSDSKPLRSRLDTGSEMLGARGGGNQVVRLVGVGYLLMLVAMTFNGWLFLAVCFGAGLGYFLFAKSRRLLSLQGGPVREAQDHCH